MQDKPGEGKVLKIEKVDEINESQKLNVAPELKEIEAVSKSKFDTALARADIDFNLSRAQAIQAQNPGVVSRPSPIDELSMSAQKVLRIEPASEAKLIAQATQIRADLGKPVQTINDALKANPNIRISPVDEAPLAEHLVHIDSSLRSALGIAGVETTGLAPKPGLPTAPINAPVGVPPNHPLMQFLGYLTNGDKQVDALMGEVQGLSLSSKDLSPTKLLAVQVKLNFVQQEIEFFTNILNKALESTKTIMNVQV